jgi:hypothetical protein
MSQDDPNKASATISGQVVRKLVARGSKSERDAIMLVTREGKEFLLRRRHGHPFQDKVLDDLVGKIITLKGSLIDNLLLMDEWTKDD